MLARHRKEFVALTLVFLQACAPLSEISLNEHDDHLHGSGVITDTGTNADIDDPSVVQPGAGDTFALGAVAQTIKPELKQALQFNIAVTAAANPAPITVNLSSSAAALPAGANLTVTFAQAAVTLNPSETKMVGVTLASALNSASFSAANLTISGSDGTNTKSVAQSVGVSAILRISLSSINPYVYDFPAGDILVKLHPSTKVFLQNMTAATNVRFHVNPTQFHAPAAAEPGEAHMFDVPQNITTIGFYDHDRQSTPTHTIRFSNNN